MIFLYTAYATILGLFVGSFLNVLIPRLHHNQKGIWLGRSACPNCKKNLKAIDLIPVISYIFLGGKCRFCKKHISAYYPLTELAIALLFGTFFYITKDISNFLLLAPSLFVLGFIFFYDLRYKEIHEFVLVPGIVFVLITSLLQGEITNGLTGAVIAGLFFGLQYLISKGRWIGSGDIYIGIFMGLFLGWEKTLVALIVSYMIGSLIGIILLISKKAKPQTALPLGPFLVLGTVLASIYRTNLIEFYFGI